jgi:hypothetical protein
MDTDLNKAVALLKAGDWEAAHHIVQDDVSSLGAWAHGIVHILEGDMANAGYWYRRADRPLPAKDGAGTEMEALAAALEGPHSSLADA